jgi:hypothetical protein
MLISKAYVLLALLKYCYFLIPYLCDVEQVFGSTSQHVSTLLVWAFVT